MKDYYAVLGVKREASQQQIRTAYRELSKKHHPDLGDGSEQSIAIFKEVQEANRVLKDVNSRQAYDAQWQESTGNQSGEKERFTQSNGRAKAGKQTFDMDNLEKSFEHFFGFNPKTKEKSSTANANKKNPIDTSDLFEHFFNKR